jgi:hypothetical protein
VNGLAGQRGWLQALRGNHRVVAVTVATWSQRRRLSKCEACGATGICVAG